MSLKSILTKTEKILYLNIRIFPILIFFAVALYFLSGIYIENKLSEQNKPFYTKISGEISEYALTGGRVIPRSRGSRRYDLYFAIANSDQQYYIEIESTRLLTYPGLKDGIIETYYHPSLVGSETIQTFGLTLNGKLIETFQDSAFDDSEFIYTEKGILYKIQRPLMIFGHLISSLTFLLLILLVFTPLGSVSIIHENEERSINKNNLIIIIPSVLFLVLILFIGLNLIHSKRNMPVLLPQCLWIPIENDKMSVGDNVPLFAYIDRDSGNVIGLDEQIENGLTFLYFFKDNNGDAYRENNTLYESNNKIANIYKVPEDDSGSLQETLFEIRPNQTIAKIYTCKMLKKPWEGTLISDENFQHHLGTISEFRIGLLNYTKPGDSIREITFQKGSQNTTFWFVKKDTHWILVDTLQWLDETEF